MDAKYPANLDPKLKEAYDRVMGGTTGASHHPKPAQPPTHPQQHHEEPKKEEPHHVDKQEQVTVVHLDEDTEKGKKVDKDEASSQGSPVTAILLGIIGMLFFIGYALFWAQIFGFNLIPSI